MIGWGSAEGQQHAFLLTPQVQLPVAVCKDVTVPASSNCMADASFDNGSYDPDGDSITLIQSPGGPYPFGSTGVTLTVTDSKGASSQCTGTVIVVDLTPPCITEAFARPSQFVLMRSADHVTRSSSLLTANPSFCST
jgi:hypothetical protein